ncbi:hypothetical protein AHAS_Ahas15G0127000 [Arachis hypogaea]
MELSNELPDHTGIQLEKIPYIRLRFDSLQLAQEILQRSINKSIQRKKKNTLPENDVTAIWNIAVNSAVWENES